MPVNADGSPPRRFNSEKQTSEMFNTAGRTVKSGLVASAVVSSWTWAATLLQSSSMAYKYGVSGPFWVRLIPWLSRRFGHTWHNEDA
jgi:Na+/proline symporter